MCAFVLPYLQSKCFFFTGWFYSIGQYGEYLCFSAAHCAPSKSHRKKQQKCKQFAFASIVILDYFIN